MTNIKPTLTIGIPAYNEEKNIGNLLNSICSQEYNSIELRSIIVVCDGCTDETVNIVNSFATNNSIINIHVTNNRSGKADGLNKIYKLANTDYLMTIDADVIFLGIKNIDLMARTMIQDKRINLVGPFHVPTQSKTMVGNFSRLSALLFLDAVAEYNNGSNFYSCMSVEFMRKSFYKSFCFPIGTIADQCYAYGQSIKNNIYGYKLVRDAKVVFGVAQTFHDWRVLSVRSTIGDKSDTLKHFGASVLPLYSMPRNLLIKSTLKWLLKSPLYCTGAILMNIYIRIFPYNHKVKKGIWEMVESSKVLYI